MKELKINRRVRKSPKGKYKKKGVIYLPKEMIGNDVIIMLYKKKKHPYMKLVNKKELRFR